mgnify:CR=1 FL=1
MSDLSPILSLPLLQASQAQKHVTHNEALMQLDLLVQLTVADRTRTAPPPGPVEGQRHIIAAAPTGAWVGQAGKIALWLDGVWQFVTPLTGWRAWVTAETAELTFTGSAWVAPSGATIPPVLSVDEIGVSATSDATKSNALALMQALGVLTTGPQAVLGASLGTLQASVGRIAVGGVADLCIFDPNAAWTVQPDALRSQGKHTPFGGHELPVSVRATLVAGQLAHLVGAQPQAAQAFREEGVRETRHDHQRLVWLSEYFCRLLHVSSINSNLDRPLRSFRLL